MLSRFGYALISQLIGDLVFSVSTVPFDPVPLNTVFTAELIEQLPKVLVFHRLLIGSTPLIEFPARHPFGDAFAHVLRVGSQYHFARVFQRSQRLDRSGEFHAVISGFRFASTQGLFNAAVAQQCTPAAWAGITFARTIGEYLYFFQCLFT